ncbi:CopG family transcriptional regulator [Amycolatopsis sp. NPDC059021]|uniref:CopG family transcriptional regulator n=1 Tax=Amycolatopsis sp. NPDC059021 TaxID=3346704 RepID=UPI00366F428D
MDMTLRLTEEQAHALRQLAEADGVSEQEAVVRAITEAAVRVRAGRIAALSREGRTRYASLLDRLAQ